MACARPPGFWRRKPNRLPAKGGTKGNAALLDGKVVDRTALDVGLADLGERLQYWWGRNGW